MYQLDVSAGYVVLLYHCTFRFKLFSFPWVTPEDIFEMRVPTAMTRLHISEILFLATEHWPLSVFAQVAKAAKSNALHCVECEILYLGTSWQ